MSGCASSVTPAASLQKPSVAASSPHVQFTVSVIQLASQAVLLAFCARLGRASTAVESWIGLIVFVAAAGYAFVWSQIYGGSLTRRRRATFHEPNILDTYQPRARTMGHLFEPEPPTPVPADQQAAATTAPQQSQSNFNQLRDQHYANEFTHCQRTAKEMDEAAATKDDDDKPSSAKVEGPVVIDFKEESEEEDDDDRNIGSYRQDL